MIYNFKALKINENANDKIGIIGCYINLGNVYAKYNNYSKAIYFFKQANVLSKDIKNKNLESECANAIGVANLESNNSQMALISFLRSLELNKENDNDLGIAKNSTNIGCITSVLMFTKIVF